MEHYPAFGRPRLLIALLALAQLGACGDAALDNWDSPTVELQVLTTPWTDPTAVGDVAAGTFAVTAVIPFPCAPYGLYPRAHILSNSLTLRIEGRYQAGCPQDIVGTLSYRAEVTNVPAGTYQLRVVNAHREWSVPPDTIFDGPIVIP
ncbi:MAG: hypothetical protein ABMA00_12785 [Gemmatimonas sp.]